VPILQTKLLTFNLIEIIKILSDVDPEVTKIWWQPDKLMK
jgi:hypothetical protein